MYCMSSVPARPGTKSWVTATAIFVTVVRLSNNEAHKQANGEVGYGSVEDVKDESIIGHTWFT